jgi:ribosomal-protein-alanine N-acetyltransferase
MSTSPRARRATSVTASASSVADAADGSARVVARQTPAPNRRVPRELPGRGTPSVAVRVAPARLDWLEALAEGDDVFTERFGIAVETGWTGFPEALPAAVETARRQPEDRWGTHLFLDGDGALVGLGGFYGPPVDGMVEIGYAVAPSRQGRGIATAAVDILLAQAAEAGVRVVRAHTLAEVNPSTSVLGKTGFVRTSAQNDPDLGEVWRWERVTG